MKLQKFMCTTCMKERESWREEVITELELLLVVFQHCCVPIWFSSNMWVMWTEHSSSAKAVTMLNCSAISSALGLLTYFITYSLMDELMRIIHFMYMGLWPACIYITCMPGTLWDQKQAWIPVAGVANDVALSCASWELNLFLEQQ